MKDKYNVDWGECSIVNYRILKDFEASNAPVDPEEEKKEQAQTRNKERKRVLKSKVAADLEASIEEDQEELPRRIQQPSSTIDEVMLDMTTQEYNTFRSADHIQQIQGHLMYRKPNDPVCSCCSGYSLLKNPSKQNRKDAQL